MMLFLKKRSLGGGLFILKWYYWKINARTPNIYKELITLMRDFFNKFVHAL